MIISFLSATRYGKNLTFLWFELELPDVTPLNCLVENSSWRLVRFRKKLGKLGSNRL